MGPITDVLDHRIGYSRLAADCAGDPTSLQEVEDAKDKLEQYFCTHYCTPPSRPVTPLSSSAPPSSTCDSPNKVDFTSQTLPVESVDEWGEFLTLKCESFKTCDPI